MKWQNVINLLIGIWLVISAFVFGGGGTNLWNYLVCGILVFILSIWAGGKEA